MLQRMLSWIRSMMRTQRPPYHPSPDVFPKLDLEELRDRLRPAEKGRRDAAIDQPRSTAESLGATELEITGFFEEEQSRCLALADRQLKALRDGIGHLQGQISTSSIEMHTRRATGDLQTLQRSGLNQLDAEASSLKALSADLAAFKARHGLQRQARYPESRKWHWGVLTTFVAVEALINGYLFARGNPLGVLGGVSEAILLAGLNVAVGLVAGRAVFPNLIHRSWLRKAPALGGLFAYILLAVVVNLAVAHYRDALVEPPFINAPARALSSLINAPFELGDLTGWFLLGIGLLFNCGAALDGWRMDDPYPGYGILHRDKSLAQADYAASVEEFHDEAQEIRDLGLTALTAIEHQSRLAGVQQEEYKRRSEHLHKLFQQHQRSLEASFRLLIAEYRAENESARKTPRPDTFVRDVILPAQSLAPIETSAPMPDLGARLADAAQEINQAYSATIAAFDSVRSLSDTEVQ